MSSVVRFLDLSFSRKQTRKRSVEGTGVKGASKEEQSQRRIKYRGTNSEEQKQRNTKREEHTQRNKIQRSKHKRTKQRSKT
jgi:hypothetical protein